MRCSCWVGVVKYGEGHPWLLYRGRGKTLCTDSVQQPQPGQAQLDKFFFPLLPLPPFLQTVLCSTLLFTSITFPIYFGYFSIELILFVLCYAPWWVQPGSQLVLLWWPLIDYLWFVFIPSGSLIPHHACLLRLLL